MQPRGQVRIAERDHRDVVGHRHPALERCLIRAHRDSIGQADERGRGHCRPKSRTDGRSHLLRLPHRQHSRPDPGAALAQDVVDSAEPETCGCARSGPAHRDDAVTMTAPGQRRNR